MPADGSPRQLSNLLRGDLDAILAMALRHAPAERYASAGALANDLQNHLDALPVQARARHSRDRGRSWLRSMIRPASSVYRLERLLVLGFGAVVIAWLPEVLDQPAETAPSASDPSRGAATSSPPMEDLAEHVAWIVPVDNPHLASALVARARSEVRLQHHAAERAIRVARTTRDQHLLTEALLLEAEALDILGKPAEADRALAEAARLFRQRADRLGLARASLVFRNTPDWDRRPLALDEALEVFRAHGHRAGEALALVRVGKATIHHDPHRTEAMMREGLRLAEALGARRIQAEAWSNLASWSVGFNALEEADERFATAVRLPERSKIDG